MRSFGAPKRHRPPSAGTNRATGSSPSVCPATCPCRFCGEIRIPDARRIGLPSGCRGRPDDPVDRSSFAEPAGRRPQPLRRQRLADQQQEQGDECARCHSASHVHHRLILDTERLRRRTSVLVTIAFGLPCAPNSFHNSSSRSGGTASSGRRSELGVEILSAPTDLTRSERRCRSVSVSMVGPHLVFGQHRTVTRDRDVEVDLQQLLDGADS